MQKSTFMLTALLGALLTTAPASAAIVTSDLQLHFDAGSLTGLSNGDDVSTWDDSSGNNRDANNVINTAPSYVDAANGFNSLPAVHFNGAAGVEGLSGTFIGNEFSLNNASIVVVYRSNSTASGGETVISLDQNGGTENGTNKGFVYLNRYANDTLFATYDGSSGDNGGSQDLGPNNYSSGDLFIFTSTWQSPSTVTLRALGDNTFEDNTYTDTGVSQTIERFTLGVLNNGTSAPLRDADVFEILVYNTALTDSQIRANEFALTSKYGITYALPEPSTGAMLLLALSGLAARRQRRND